MAVPPAKAPSIEGDSHAGNGDGDVAAEGPMVGAGAGAGAPAPAVAQAALVPPVLTTAEEIHQLRAQLELLERRSAEEQRASAAAGDAEVLAVAGAGGVHPEEIGSRSVSAHGGGEKSRFNADDGDADSEHSEDGKEDERRHSSEEEVGQGVLWGDLVCGYVPVPEKTTAKSRAEKPSPFGAGGFAASDGVSHANAAALNIAQPNTLHGTGKKEVRAFLRSYATYRVACAAARHTPLPVVRFCSDKIRSLAEHAWRVSHEDDDILGKLNDMLATTATGAPQVADPSKRNFDDALRAVRWKMVDDLHERVGGFLGDALEALTTGNLMHVLEEGHAVGQNTCVGRSLTGCSLPCIARKSRKSWATQSGRGGRSAECCTTPGNFSSSACSSTTAPRRRTTPAKTA